MPSQTFTPGVGRLATDRYEFESHVDGADLKHNADAITITPGITLNSSTQTDVYSALSAIGVELANLELSGKGFLLVGDGYDTYANSISTPNTPYDSSVPALNTYLHDVLNNSSNPLYFRIRDGGVVMIKAGTYKFTGTVDVPPGIILLGEGYGTKIVNQMSSPAPLFKIKRDSSRTPDLGVDSTEQFIFCKETIFVNLTIADNFLVPKFLGDLSYKDPINNDSTNPLVAVEEGASLSCENVRFVGKTAYTLGQVSNLTSFAIKTDSSIITIAGTRLKVFNCSIDGFACPVQFTASGGKNDHFIMSNTLVRGYGYLNADFITASNNTILKLNACNINVSNNYIFGYDDTVTSALYVILPSTPPVLQALAKVNVIGNNIAIDRTNSADNTTFQLIKYSAVFNNDIAVTTAGNNFKGIIEADGGIISRTKSISSATYTVDSLNKDYIILANTASTAITITLPDATISGRILIIKDKGGNATSNNITLARFGGTGSIEGVAASYVMDVSYQQITLVSDAGNWWIIR